MKKENVLKLIQAELEEQLAPLEKRLSKIETMLDIRQGDFNGNSILVNAQIKPQIKLLEDRIETVELKQKIVDLTPKIRARSRFKK